MSSHMGWIGQGTHEDSALGSGTVGVAILEVYCKSTITAISPP